MPTNLCKKSLTEYVGVQCALINEVKFKLDDSYSGEYRSRKDLSLLFSSASVILINNFNIKFR